MALKGQDFGKAEDWLSGANQAVFFDGVPASRTELTQEADLATLLIVVPKGAQGGPLVIRVGEVQSEAVTVMITNAGAMLRPLLAVPVCEEVLPPPTAVDADAYLPHSGE